MKTLISEFAIHLRKSLDFSIEHQDEKIQNNINQVLISGMGGSGIAGRIASQLYSRKSKIPLLVNNNYTLPGYAEDETLVIASSYSGNTEESLYALQSALEKNTTIACITSGGKMLEIAEKEKKAHILLPSGMPPRAAFGFSFTALLKLLEHFDVIDSGYKGEISGFIELLLSEEQQIVLDAEEMARHLVGKLPVIYSDERFEGVAVRFKQQINENSKMLCGHNVFPELNHNEIVGWKHKNDQIAIVILRNSNDFKRIQKRMNITSEILRKKTKSVYEIYSKGETDLQKTLFLVHFCDWISFFLSELNGADVMEVDVIDYLKSELAKE